jgi:transcriptional regulator with XRE-family HTH domain
MENLMSKIDFTLSNVSEAGQAIKSRRKTLGMTQIELGRVLGISNTYLSDIEVGKTIPSLKTIIKLFSKLDLDLKIVARKGIEERINKK